MRILITGANGFLGRNLIQNLSGHREFVIFALGRFGSNMLLNQKITQRISRLYFKRYDDLKNLVAAARPDIVIHCATFFHAEHKSEDIVPMIDANLTYGTLLLESLRDLQKKVLFINVGTSWQHCEDETFRGANGLHAALKTSYESVLRFYQSLFDLRLVNLKLFDTYGVGDTRAKLINLVFNALRTNESLALTAGEQLIDIVHISDVCRCFELVCLDFLKNELVEGTYGVSSGTEIPMKTIIDTILSISGADKKLLRLGSRPYRSREVMSNWRKGLTTYPRWHPQISIEDGLTELWRYQGLVSTKK
jgi:nucleoside-diphosphate-sugar epimerase